MRRLALLCLVLLASAVSLAWSEAEVSKKKEVAVFPMFSSEELPESAWKFFDDKLIGIISDMKRFQVIGYQYRLDNNSAEQFIAKIQSYKKQAALSDPKYVDADLGIAVIPASELKQLANSFFIFIPSITGYSSRTFQVEVREVVKDKLVVKLKTKYEATVDISIKIIDADGNLLNTYNASRKVEKETSVNDAFRDAVNQGISGLNFHLRNMDQFKLKSQVLKVNLGGVAMELGANLGINPGYEFVLQKEERILDKFTEKTTVGLVRVSKIGEQWSEATTIFGDPKVGDQLIEAPMVGGRMSIFAGVSEAKTTGADLLMYYYDESGDPDYMFRRINFAKSSMAANVGLTFAGEIGYGGLFDLGLGVLVSDPLAAYMDIGGGYEIYFGPCSLNALLDLSVVGNWKSLGSMQLNSGSVIEVNSTNFSSDVSVDLRGITFGIKPKLGFNVQVSQSFKLRISAAYGLYFLPFYQMVFTGKEYFSGEMVSSTINLDNKNLSFYNTAGTEIDNVNDIMKQLVDYSGFTAGIEAVFRF